MTYGAPIDVRPPPVLDAELRGPRYAQRLVDVARAVVRRVEKKVTQAGLDIRGEVALPAALDAVKALQWKNQAVALSPATYRRSHYYYDQDHHYIDGAGNPIRITRGGALDLSSVGGITGEGYGQNGAAINWDGAGVYSLKAAVADFFADLEVDDVKLASGAASFVRLTAQAMTADAAWRLPVSAPLVKSNVYLDPDGDVTLENTLRHGDIPLMVGATTGWAGTLGGGGDHATNLYALAILAGYTWKIPLPMQAGDRIKSVTVYANKGGATTLTMSLQRALGASTVTIDSWTTATSGVVASLRTLATPYTVQETEGISLMLQNSGADYVFGAKVIYDRP